MQHARRTGRRSLAFGGLASGALLGPLGGIAGLQRAAQAGAQSSAAGADARPAAASLDEAPLFALDPRELRDGNRDFPVVGPMGVAVGDRLHLTWRPRLVAGPGDGYQLVDAIDVPTLDDGSPLADPQPARVTNGFVQSHQHVHTPALEQALTTLGALTYEVRRVARWRHPSGHEVTATGAVTVRRDVVPPPVQGPPVLAWYYLWRAKLDDVPLAERAGLDAFIVSETAVNPREVIPAELLDRVKGSSLRLTLGVEPQTHPSRAHHVERLRQVVAFAHAYPRWLRLAGRPVLVFWNLPSVKTAGGERPQDAWRAIRDEVDPGHTTVWIAEGGDTNPERGTLTYLTGGAFDGLHLYSIAWADDPAQQLANWAARVRRADPGLLWAATVMPGGYWGAPGSATPYTLRPRQDGEFYRRTWAGAMATNPAMYVITSWNEVPEKTAIRPEPETSELDFGTTYVDLTRELAAQAKARR